MALISSRSTGAPVDRDQEGDTGMSNLEKYDAVINGWPTTVKLTEAEARERGLTRAKPPAKARAAANKGRTPANKARTPADKSGDTGDDGTGDPGNGDQGTDTPDAGQGD